MQRLAGTNRTWHTDLSLAVPQSLASHQVAPSHTPERLKGKKAQCKMAASCQRCCIHLPLLFTAAACSCLAGDGGAHWAAPARALLLHEEMLGAVAIRPLLCRFSWCCCAGPLLSCTAPPVLQHAGHQPGRQLQPQLSTLHEAHAERAQQAGMVYTQLAANTLHLGHARPCHYAGS